MSKKASVATFCLDNEKSGVNGSVLWPNSFGNTPGHKLASGGVTAVAL